MNEDNILFQTILYNRTSQTRSDCKGQQLSSLTSILLQMLEYSHWDQYYYDILNTHFDFFMNECTDPDSNNIIDTLKELSLLATIYVYYSDQSYYNKIKNALSKIYQ